MADIQALEQRFEGISVQDENIDYSSAPAAHHKSKVGRLDYATDENIDEYYRAPSPTPSPFPISVPQARTV